MHRPYLLLVTTLLGVASLLVTGVAMSIPNLAVEATDPLPAEHTVRRFYDAVNMQIRTGDPAELLDVLHPDFIDKQPLPGFASDAAGLVDHATALHGNSHTVEIVVESLVATGDEVSTAVNVQHANGASDSRFESASPVWASMERFRVEGDQIIERSSSNRNLIVVQERFDLPLALDPGSQNAYMATHWKFEASASTRFQTSGGPAVLHVLSGEPAITVTSDAAASGLRSPEVHEPESADSNPVTVDDIVRLAKGSTVTLPQGVGFVVSTPDGAASALFVSREGTSPLGPGIGVGLSNSVGGKARYLGSLPSNLEVETSLTARLHRIVLMPGALVSNLGTTGASTPLIWLEAGSVLTEHSRPAVYGAATVNINRQFVGGVRLSPDDEPAYLWEPAATLHNTSSEPAVLWVLSSDTPAE